MPIRIARSERAARLCVGVRQLLAVDPEVKIVAAVADQPSLRQACDEEHSDAGAHRYPHATQHTDEVAAQRRRSTSEAAARQRRDHAGAEFDAIKAKALA